MFDALEMQPADGILALIKAFRDDARRSKIDLGVGVYRDRTGATPVMRAVKGAEALLLESQDSKRYLGPEGDLAYVSHLLPIIFGADHGFGERLVGVQTPGGGGALRLGAELVAAANPKAKVWLGTPSWPNHRPIFKAARLTVQDYLLVDPATQAIAMEGVLDALSQAEAGDVVLLHGCCHNPTGIDPTPDQWTQILEVIKRRRLIPFVDLAYQGLGDGLEPDAAATRAIFASVDEALLAYSCDKNFGLYRERVGALYVLGRDGSAARKADSNMTSLARVNWSMPPDHGAAVVRTILERPDLKAQWRDELKDMGGRLRENRRALAEVDPALEFIRRQRGLFSTLAMTRDQAVALRREDGIYLTDGGRINLAGMQREDAPAIVAALHARGCL